MRARSLVVLFILLVSAAPAVAATAVSDFSGQWEGRWTGGSSHDVYTSKLQLIVDETNHASGTILWTLEHANPARVDTRGKEGMSGTEYVAGHVEGQELFLDGVRVDDPHEILGVDKYRLVLSDDGSTLGGITANGESWTGFFWNRRK